MSYFDSIYADTLLPPRAVSVYMYLKDRPNRAGSCWPVSAYGSVSATVSRLSPAAGFTVTSMSGARIS